MWYSAPCLARVLIALYFRFRVPELKRLLSASRMQASARLQRLP